MNIIRSLILSALIGLTFSASALSFDLTGMTVDGSGLTIVPVSNLNSAPVTAVYFDLTYSTAANSGNGALGSELLVQIGHLPSQTFIQIGTVALDGSCSGFSVFCDYDLMLEDTGGEFQFAGSVDFDTFQSDFLSNLISDGSGVWELVIGTSIDGGPGSEGEFLSGSIVLSQVPLPGAAWLFLAALSFLGLLRRSN